MTTSVAPFCGEFPLGQGPGSTPGNAAEASTVVASWLDQTNVWGGPFGTATPVSQAAPMPVQIIGGGSGSAAPQVSATALIDTVTLTSANTAQQLPSIATTLGASLQNQSTTDTIYVGVSSALTSAGAHGYKLAPGQVLGVSAANLNAYWFNGPSTNSTLGYSVN